MNNSRAFVSRSLLGAFGLLIAFVFASNRGLAQEKDDGEKKDAEGKGTTKVLSTEEKYVRDHLEKYLYPSDIKYLDDGRVMLQFDLRKKQEEHIEIFTPRVGSRIKDRFRWSLPDEEHWAASKGDDIGLRVSNSGMALINCWFEDDLEAEMYFVQKVNFNVRQYAALVYCNDKGLGIGSNLGTQCGSIRRGRFRAVKGKALPVINDASNTFGLKIKGGTFEVSRRKRPKASTKYPEKRFSSGRIGIAWGGGVMGYVAEIKVTGRLDYEKMAKFLKKVRR